MKIRINETNRQKIENVLEKIQKRASSRTQSFDSILTKSVDAEKHLDEYDVPKKHRQHTTLTFAEMVQTKSYKYSYESTQVTISRGGNDWFLTGVQRVSGWPGERDIQRYEPTSAALGYLRNKIVSDFCG